MSIIFPVLIEEDVDAINHVIAHLETTVMKRYAGICVMLSEAIIIDSKLSESFVQLYTDGQGDDHLQAYWLNDINSNGIGGVNTPTARARRIKSLKAMLSRDESAVHEIRLHASKNTLKRL